MRANSRPAEKFFMKSLHLHKAKPASYTCSSLLFEQMLDKNSHTEIPYKRSSQNVPFPRLTQSRSKLPVGLEVVQTANTLSTCISLVGVSCYKTTSYIWLFFSQTDRNSLTILPHNNNYQNVLVNNHNLLVLTRTSFCDNSFE